MVLLYKSYLVWFTFSFYITTFIFPIAPSSGPVISDYFANSTSLFLEWTPPSQDTWNGIIQEYHIVVEEDITGTTWTYRTSNVYKTITNLHPYYVYVCSVHAVTIAMGPSSESVYITTQEESKLSN